MPRMGKRHLGTLSVSGFKRVPWPAANKKAFMMRSCPQAGDLLKLGLAHKDVNVGGP